MFDDSVQVRCRRCRSVFRERARRLQSGYTRQCPTCEVVLFFDDDSPDQATRRAMKNARHVRAALREAEAAQPGKKRVVRGSGRRGSHEASEAEADETA
jgi:predicted  nucleic acid-binding Zn-ribbon protein